MAQGADNTECIGEKRKADSNDEYSCKQKMRPIGITVVGDSGLVVHAMG